MTDQREESIVLLLRMQRGAHPPRGSVGTADGETYPFCGWSGLAAGIEAATRPAQDQEVPEMEDPTP